jgi:hypothetical protein
MLLQKKLPIRFLMLISFIKFNVFSLITIYDYDLLLFQLLTSVD